MTTYWSETAVEAVARYQCDVADASLVDIPSGRGAAMAVAPSIAAMARANFILVGDM